MPATITIDAISVATIPMTEAKLRYVKRALPSSSRIRTVSPAGMPVVKRKRAFEKPGFCVAPPTAAASGGEGAAAPLRRGLSNGSVGGSSSSASFFLYRRR
jgi:hypothetical protein